MCCQVIHNRRLQVVEYVNDILPHIHVGRWLFLLRTYDDAQSLFNDFDRQVCIGHHGVTIEVDDARIVSVNLQPFAPDGLDFTVLVECAVYHLERDGRCIQHGEWLHDDDIHQAIAK